MQLTSLASMRRTSFSGMNCSIAQRLETVGEWWHLLTLRDEMRQWDDRWAAPDGAPSTEPLSTATSAG